ncbi:MAG: hypothetical protein ABC596_05785 [Candidatus Methanosuratincola petrocarbonis]
MEEKDRVEIVWREEAPLTIPPTFDNAWKGIYQIKNGKLILVKTVRSNPFPAHCVGEEIVFDEEACDR